VNFGWSMAEITRLSSVATDWSWILWNESGHRES